MRSGRKTHGHRRGSHVRGVWQLSIPPRLRPSSAMRPGRHVTALLTAVDSCSHRPCSVAPHAPAVLQLADKRARRATWAVVVS